jgi:hypothetical protein
MSNIAKYSPATDTWSTIGGAADDNVYAVAVSPEGHVYIGGSFKDAGMRMLLDPPFDLLPGTLVEGVNYWDGSAWHGLGNGIGGTGNPVRALKFMPNGSLLIGGDFNGGTAPASDFCCIWDGSAFKSFTDYGATELSHAVYSIDITPGGTIVIGGNFINAGGDPNADYVAAWRGTNWGALRAGGVNNKVYKVYCADNGDIYLSGAFTQAGSLTLTDKIAVSKDGAFQPLDIDLPGSGYAGAFLRTSDGSLYFGGTFNAADGNAIATITTETLYETASSSGSANTYPEVAIVGPGTLQSISNFSTGQKITFNGLTLHAGERLMLYLDPTALKMTSSWSGRGSVWRYLNAGSDIGNWFIRPGGNYLGVFIPSGYDVDKTKVYVQWQPKYWSLDGAVY